MFSIVLGIGDVVVKKFYKVLFLWELFWKGVYEIKEINMLILNRDKCYKRSERVT